VNEAPVPQVHSGAISQSRTECQTPTKLLPLSSLMLNCPRLMPACAGSHSSPLLPREARHWPPCVKASAPLPSGPMTQLPIWMLLPDGACQCSAQVPRNGHGTCFDADGHNHNQCWRHPHSQRRFDRTWHTVEVHVIAVLDQFSRVVSRVTKSLMVACCWAMVLRSWLMTWSVLTCCRSSVFCSGTHRSAMT